jgi:hypothetical protein
MAIRPLIATLLLMICTAITGCGCSADKKGEVERSSLERRSGEEKAVADTASAEKAGHTSPEFGLAEARRAAERYLNAARTDFEGNEARPLLTEAFRQRLRALRGPEVLVSYEYDGWEITGQKVELDGGRIEFKGKAHVTVWRKYQDIGPGGRAWQSIPSGGQAEFALSLGKGKDGVWLVDDFRFGKRSIRQVLPVEATPGEVKAAVHDMLELPQPIRGDVSPKELADELKTKVWTFAYTGGPLQCRVLVEEAGQKTYGGEGHVSIPDEYLRFGESEGHICLWMRQVLSERMKQNALRVGKVGDTRGAVVGRPGAILGVSFPFLWYHWDGATFTERKLEAVLEQDKEVTVLEVEATERRAPPGKAPRKVKLTMTAKPLPTK